MAIKWVGPNIICLSTDTLPTNVPTNTQAWITDSRRIVYYNGTTWLGVRTTPSARKHLIYKVGSTYYHERYDGSVVNSGSVFETVLQAAIDNTGDVYILGGADYICSGSFTGFNIKGFTMLEIDRGAVIEVPNGYTGNVFHISDTAFTPQAQRIRTVIRGGRLREAGTPQKLWTGIKLHSTDFGIVDGEFMGMTISEPKTGVEFNTSNVGWVANCIFDMIQVNDCVNGMEFIDTTTDANGGTFRNTFKDVHIQDQVGASAIISYGFKNITGKYNTFINCKAWDMIHPATQKLCTIAPKAVGTIIIGGLMAREDDHFFIDNSWPRSTLVLSDDTHALSYGGLAVPHTSMVGNGRRVGGYDGTSSTTGWGIIGTLTAYAGAGGNAQVNTFANGSTARNHPTGTTLGNGTGFRYINLLTMRGWNPRYRAKIRLGTSTLQTLYLGFASVVSADLAGDDPLNAVAGVMFGMRSADTTFQIMHNDTSGATNFINTGVTINTTAIRTFDLKAIDVATNKWQWSIDGSAWAEITSTDIPSQSTPLGLHTALVTNESGVAKNMEVFEVRVETN